LDLLVADAEGGDALSQLNINSRGSPNTLLMPTDDTVKQQQSAAGHDTVMVQLNLMNVDVASQQQVVQQVVQPGENVVNQLNIRQRMNGMGEVSRLMQMEDLEVRLQCTTEQHGFEDEQKLTDKYKFLYGDGNVESSGSNENMPEWDLDELDKMLSSLGPGQSVGGMGDTDVQNEEQNMMVEEPVVSSVVPSTPALNNITSAGRIDTQCLYSPSPHSTNTESSVAVQGPLSPTAFAGTLLQQLTIDNGSLVGMAIGGSVGPPVQIIHYVPTQV